MLGKFFRAYEPGVDRREGADRLVYDEEDFRAVLGSVALGEDVATIRLGADIILSRPVRLGSIEYDLVVEGGGRWGFKAADASVTCFFEVNTEQVSDLAFSRVRFIGDGTTPAAIFHAAGAPASLERVSFDRAALEGITQVIAADAAGVVWRDSALTFEEDAGAAVGPVTFTGVVALSDGTTSYFVASESVLSITAAGLGVGGVDAPQGGFELGSALLLTPRSVTIQSTGATLTPGDRTYLRVTHTSAAGGNITIAPGVAGQLLVLEFVSVAGTASYADGIGNLVLASGFTPTAGDTLTLIFNGTSWVELSRSVN